MSNMPILTTEAADTITCLQQQITDLEGEISISDELREKMAGILTRSVNAIRGNPKSLNEYCDIR